MPIYEYRCQSCHKDLEVLVRGKNEPTECPDCHGALTRKVSLAGVIFKGSGFYVNDSRKDSSSSGKSSSHTEVKTDGSSTESKPSASTEAPKESSSSSSAKNTTTSSTSPSSSKPVD